MVKYHNSATLSRLRVHAKVVREVMM
jgi:hypothetical protein